MSDESRSAAASQPSSIIQPIIRWENVSVVYPDDMRPALDNVNLQIEEGELTLVIGPTGSGKSTLLRTINGLVPHFTGGTLHGRVMVDGRDTSQFPPRELADVVGYVPQDPQSGFVTDTVEEELAYTMESLGLAPDVMRRRVEETLDLMGLATLRHRPLRQLSGGQRQRVAIGSVLTAGPRILVLDEPTSALDPGAAEDVLGAVQRLVHDLGITVVLAEHRLERVIEYADRVILVPGGGRPLVVGEPADVMVQAPIAPPVVRLGRLAGWSPLPLSVRDARRLASGLRHQLTAPTPDALPAPSHAEPISRTRDLVISYGRNIALRGVTWQVHSGEIVALMGRNGAGKSTLLQSIAGLHAVTSGHVDISGHDPRGLRGRDLVRNIGLVPQEFSDLLTRLTVSAECRDADQDADAPAGTTAALLRELSPDVDPDAHPRDLSEGQRLSLALAVVLAGRPPLLCLDEPTRGLDYETKARLAATLSRLRDDGLAIIVATHDVELVAEIAQRVVILADGEIVADGPTASVVVSSPLFAPQVAKILSTPDAPAAWLTAGAVEAALAGTP
jgi:energy-coupling factor transport system ATP-binding protein